MKKGKVMALMLVLILIITGCTGGGATVNNEETNSDVRRPTGIMDKKIYYEADNTEKVKINKDLEYRERIDNREFLMDVYTPHNLKKDTKLPAVILVHGEADMPKIKDTGYYDSVGRLVASQDFIAVVFNHRVLVGGATISEVVSDIEAAIEYVIENADELRIDKDNIGIWAFSGGVPPATYIGLTNSSYNLNCLVVYYGLMDYTGLTSEVDEKYLPLKVLEAESINKLPIFIARAGKDFRINITLDSFVNKALANSFDITLFNHAEGVHAFEIYNDDARTREIIKGTLDFLKEHLHN